MTDDNSRTNKANKFTNSRNEERLNRREYLKLTGTIAVSATAIQIESDVAQASDGSYGHGGYGEGPYGGSGFSVTTESPTSIDATSATLNGELTDLDGADSAECYFEWRQTGASSWNTTTTQTLSSTGTFSDSLSGLEENVEYEYRTVGDASDGDSATGTTVSFTTTDGSPAVTTESPSNVGTTSATLNGSLDDLGGASSADCYFDWRTVGADTWNSTSIQTLSATGSFSADVSDLEDGVEYEYKAVADTSDGDSATGTTVSFTTTDNSPAVTTDSPSDITDSSATLNGTLDDLGGASSADCFFEWRSVGADTWNTTSSQTLSSLGSFSTVLNDLSPSTDYEYRAVAQASDGDSATGSTISFTTESSSTAPAIDSYSVTEAGSPNPHAEISADWAVSDDDADLKEVTVEVFDSSGTVVDSAVTTVSGSSDSGTDSFKIKHVEGQTFDVTITVTDAEQNSTSETQSVTE